jgi:hypothetical protein
MRNLTTAASCIKMSILVDDGGESKTRPVSATEEEGGGIRKDRIADDGHENSVGSLLQTRRQMARRIL